MTVRKLSATGDMMFGHSQLDFISNSPATVAQVVKTSFLLWNGEWYLDTSQGMPWIEGVLGYHDSATADATVQDYCLSVQGVQDISNFTSTPDTRNRKYVASMTINTIYGATAVQVSNETLF